MLSSYSLKIWSATHKWSSLLCTAFLLILCITGLPLIFHHEIEELLHAPNFSDVTEQPKPSLQAIVVQAQTEKPDWVQMILFWDAESPMVSAILGPSMQATESDVHIVPFDSRTGKQLNLPPHNKGFMGFVLNLHANLLVGLPGTFFLGFIGLVFILSVVSGVVLYAPFMRRLPFATVRKNRSRRIKWLDTHNLLGIGTLAWASLVGITGVILTLATPIAAIWQQEQIAALAGQYKNVPPAAKLISPDVALASVLERVPSADVSFIAWPGSPFATPHHFTVALRGDTPLTKRLVTVALVDAETGIVTTIEKTPWYISAVNLSVPLHFGDYGSLPLKIIWALLDIVVIIVLSSGLYLLLARSKKIGDPQ